MHTESAISFIQRPSYLCPPTQQNFKNLYQSKINILASLCHSVDKMREHFPAIKAQEKPWMKLINTGVSTERKKPENAHFIGICTKFTNLLCTNDKHNYIKN